MNELALFAGAGGGILGGKLLGWRTVCAVEFDSHAREVLKARQNDGCLEPFPIWDDVRTFDGKPWQGIVDVVSGGFPCQDISCAGGGDGLEGKRSGLWKEMARIVGEVRPRYVFVENSPMLTVRGLGVVLGELASMGYNATWGVLSAKDAGAPHLRERMWIVADSDPQGTNQLVGFGGIQSQRTTQLAGDDGGSKEIRCQNWFQSVLEFGRVAPEKWRSENLGIDSRPLLLRVDDGMADGLDRLGRCGNGQVPQVVKLAWEILTSNQKP
jgi:DNA (cytosine-5)-methyltransferase 1